MAALAAIRVNEGSGDVTIAADTTVARSASSSVQPTALATSTTSQKAGTTLAETEGQADLPSVIQEALSAWGRFAATGDLAEVEPWFAVEGPQYRRFEDEVAAAERVGGPVYRVTFEPLSNHPDDPNRIRGRVVFVRTGEPSQVFDWWIVLREGDGRLRVWTVEEAGD